MTKSNRNTWMVVVIRRPPSQFMPMVRYRDLSCQLASSLAFDLSYTGEFIGSFIVDSADRKQSAKLKEDIQTMREYYDLVVGKTKKQQRRNDMRAS